MKHTIILLMIIFFTHFALGQKRMQVKYEFGLSTDKFNLINPQNNVGIFNNKQGLVGFSVSYLIKNSIQFETGFYDKFYGADLYSVVPDTANLIIGLNRIQIPLRLLYKKSLFTEKLSFAFITGISLLISHNFNGLAYSPNDSSWLTSGKKIVPFFNVYEIGAGTEYEILKNFTVGLNYRIFIGTKSIFHYQVKRTHSDNSTTDYDLKSNGNFNYVSFSLGYKFINVHKK